MSKFIIYLQCIHLFNKIINPVHLIDVLVICLFLEKILFKHNRVLLNFWRGVNICKTQIDIHPLIDLKSMSDFYVTDICTSNLCPFFKFSNQWMFLTFSNRRAMTSHPVGQIFFIQWRRSDKTRWRILDDKKGGNESAFMNLFL